MATPSQMPYTKMTITCTKCEAKQIVHVHAGPKVGGFGPQAIECLSCHKEFDVMIPDRIIDGPFLA